MAQPLLLGAVADDYTGAADLASMLREQGVRTGLLFGTQEPANLERLAGRYQALVIALKSRTAEPTAAREQSVIAARQLHLLGARQLYFKYCSTFDSTKEGNIGPVIDALLSATGSDFTVAVPALPVNGRTQYHGYLFVNGRLLAESPMRHHPLTPMTDSDLVRHLRAQTDREVGLIAHPEVRAGTATISARIDALRNEGVNIALVDVLSDADLQAVAAAVVDLPVVSGGSGLGGSLPAIWTDRGLLGSLQELEFEPRLAEKVLILSGSCSAATLEQLSVFEQTVGSGVRMDVGRLLTGDPSEEIHRLIDAVRVQLRQRGWALVYSSAPTEERAEVGDVAGAPGIAGSSQGEQIERATGEVARLAVHSALVDALIVAGGETTGAVTQALNLSGLEIGPALDPGVPVGRSLGPAPLDVIFKSGNFGGRDFFATALHYLCGAGSPSLDKPLL